VTLFEKITKKQKRTGDMAQVIVHLPGKLEALSSEPRTATKKKKKKERKKQPSIIKWQI
jgi:hypothetical protein